MKTAAPLLAFAFAWTATISQVDGADRKGNNTRPGPFGSIVEVEFMVNSTSTGQTLLFTHENSTLFTDDVPLPPPDGVWGELIPFAPLDACGPLRPSNYTRQIGGRSQFAPVGPYPHVVALVARGNCSFEEKFDFVDDIPNVIGMLMYDFEDGKNLSSFIEVSAFGMLNIPGSLIEYDPGIRLKSELDRMRTEDLRHPTDPRWIKVTLKYIPHMSQAENILQYALLVVMLILCAAFIVSVYMHYHIYRMQRRLDENRQAEARNAINIDEAFLEKLPVRQFRKLKSPVSIDLNDGAGVSKVTRSPPETIAPVEDEQVGIVHPTAPPNETCPICLDEFGQFETLNELPCGHFYHISCIRPWLQHRSSCCPMCKNDVRDAYVVLPPPEAERTWLHSLVASLKKFVNKWILCGRLPNSRGENEVVPRNLCIGSDQGHRGTTTMTEIHSNTATMINIGDGNTHYDANTNAEAVALPPFPSSPPPLPSHVEQTRSCTSALPLPALKCLDDGGGGDTGSLSIQK